MSSRKWIVFAVSLFIMLLSAKVIIRSGRDASVSLPLLQINGNKIVNPEGNAIIFHGAAIEDPGVEKKWQREESREVLLDEFTKWNLNVIRIPVHPGEYTKDPDYLAHYVDPIISYANKKGIYVLLGWHAHGNIITGESQKVDGTNDFFDADESLANRFWEDASIRYKNNSGVFYSIFNEPVFISWNEWKPKAEDLMATIRKNDQKKIVFVSGIEWASDLRGAKDNPVRGDNIGYEIHVYPKLLKKDWDSYFGYLAKDNVVLVGEWGYDPTTKDVNLRATTKDFGEPLLKYMEEKGLSWTTWIWSDTWGPPMYKDSFEPTEFGQLVKDYLDVIPAKAGI